MFLITLVKYNYFSQSELNESVDLISCLPVVSYGWKSTKIDFLVFPEVQTRSRTLRCGHNFVFSNATVDVHNSHDGFEEEQRGIVIGRAS